uniref:Uncharacterized protein n=1 Tax=Knipowitschia caucasica TaxID=637954 RepID=A0AAV2L0W4_KNICA
MGLGQGLVLLCHSATYDGMTPHPSTVCCFHTRTLSGREGGAPATSDHSSLLLLLRDNELSSPVGAGPGSKVAKLTCADMLQYHPGPVGVDPE